MTVFTMASKTYMYDTLSSIICPTFSPSIVSFVYSVPVTLDSSLSPDGPKHILTFTRVILFETFFP